MSAQRVLRAIVFLSGVWSAGAVYAADPIVVGQVATLSGVDAAPARAYSAGLQIAFAKANRGGGVNGRQLLLDRRDDKGRAQDTMTIARTLISESKPVALTGFFDHGVTELVRTRLLDNEQIPLIGFRADTVIGEPPMFYNVRASLADEIGKIAEHLATVGIVRLGFFYQDGRDAQAMVTAVSEVVKSRNVSLSVKGALKPGQVSVDDAVVAAFIKAEPQAIVIVADSRGAASFISKYRIAGGGARVFSHSGTDIAQLSKLLTPEHMKGLAITQVTPSPYRIVSRLSKEFNEAVAATSGLEEPVSYAMMEGYIAGSVIVDAIRRMGKKPSVDAMVPALENVEMDLGGYKASFKSGMQTASRFVELTIVTDAGRIRQ